MGGSRAAVLVLFPLFSLLAIIITVTHFSSSFGEVSEECLSVYEGGGISAVARAQQCSHLVRSFKNQTKNCQFASLKGQMDFNEQHIACNLNTVLPLAGKHGPEQVSVGVVALFDGIFGEEVSDAASNLLLEYLWAHSIFASYQGKLPGNDAKALHYLSNSTSGSFPLNPNESRHMRSIKEALLRAIYDIDSNFLKISMKERTFSMSMATVGVLLDSQLIVANIGDSNAILCSEKLDVHSGSTTPYLFVKELTEDREIEKERDRLLAAGADEWMYKPRALLTLPRGIGISFMKKHGVLPEIDMSDWQPLTGNDRFLVIASRSIINKVSPTEVCNALLHSGHECHSDNRSSVISSAKCVALMAIERGSLDNLSNIVVPLNFRKSNLVHGLSSLFSPLL